MIQTKKTGLILSKTNYLEKDVIFNFLCDDGDLITIIAKNMRTGFSKRSSNMQVFSLIEVSLHQKESRYLLVAAKELKPLYHLTKYVATNMTAYQFLEKSYDIVRVGAAINIYRVLLIALLSLKDQNIKIVELWFYFQIAIELGQNYELEGLENADNYTLEDSRFVADPRGNINQNDIKLLRLCQFPKIPNLKYESVGLDILLGGLKQITF